MAAAWQLHYPTPSTDAAPLLLPAGPCIEIMLRCTCIETMVRCTCIEITLRSWDRRVQQGCKTVTPAHEQGRLLAMFRRTRNEDASTLLLSKRLSATPCYRLSIGNCCANNKTSRWCTLGLSDAPIRYIETIRRCVGVQSASRGFHAVEQKTTDQR